MTICTKIEDILNNQIRVELERHGGGLDFKGYYDGVVELELKGNCVGCPSADFDTKYFIEETLRRFVPEVKCVQLVYMVPREMMDFARILLNKKYKISNMNEREGNE